MTIDRRRFTTSLLLGTGAGILGFPQAASAAPAMARQSATLLVDQATGRILHRTGPCATRFSPCSTFKIPLALIGYDAGILTDAHHPAWDYRPAVHQAHRAEEKRRTDPTDWEFNSVVWYSQEITRRLGAARFGAFVDRIGYGNRDVSGNPGKDDGLEQAWLCSSLAVSPDEQVAFLRRLLAGRLLSPGACARAAAIVPAFEGSGSWRVHGKTGSGWLRDGAGQIDHSEPLGWFVGWADKGPRRLVFARLQAGGGTPDPSAGRTARTALLDEIARLAG